MSLNNPADLGIFLRDISRAGLALTTPKSVANAPLASARDHDAELAFGRTSSAYDTRGNVYPVGVSALDIINGFPAVRVSGASTNLMPANHDVETGDTTDWTIYTVTATNGSVTASSEQAFTGDYALKVYGGDGAEDYVRAYQNYTWQDGVKYTFGFAIYSPYYRPYNGNTVYLYAGNNDVVMVNVVPTRKKGWWWAYTTITGDGVSRRFGIRVKGQNTYYVDSFVLVEGEVEPVTYIGAAKAADVLGLTIPVVPEYFTAGLRVKSDHISTMAKGDAAARILTLRRANGDQYKVEYRPSVQKFAVVKSIGAVDVEALSNAVPWRRNRSGDTADAHRTQVVCLFAEGCADPL
jgi:hypothetical protein